MMEAVAKQYPNDQGAQAAAERAQRVLKVTKTQGADGSITTSREDIYGGKIVPFVPFTKLDGDTRGGAALSVKSVTGVPIKFIGVGEQLEVPIAQRAAPGHHLVQAAQLGAAQGGWTVSDSAANAATHARRLMFPPSLRRSGELARQAWISPAAVTWPGAWPRRPQPVRPSAAGSSRPGVRCSVH